MHEASVAREIYEIVHDVAVRNQIAQVYKVTLDIGAFSCIQEDLLRFAFEVITKGSILEAAELEIAYCPAEAWCAHCAQPFPITFTKRDCPRCGKKSNQILHGREAIVKSIEGA